MVKYYMLMHEYIYRAVQNKMQKIKAKHSFDLKKKQPYILSVVEDKMFCMQNNVA